MQDENLMVSKYSKTIGTIALIAAIGCGRGLDKVETIKGPKGDRGDQGPQGQTGMPGQPGTNGQKGDKGDRGDKGDQAEPQPIPTAYPSPIVNLPPTIPYPPVIVVYPPWPTCPDVQCPSGYVVICACISNRWQTVSVSQQDTWKYQIKNYGPCY